MARGEAKDQDRNVSATGQLSEERQSLWLIAASPMIWAGHFLASYLTVALWCAKVAGRDGVLGASRTAIVVYTVLALLGIGLTTWRGYQKHTFGRAAVPHDFDTPQDRHRFIGFATLLLSVLSAVGVLFVALTIIFIDTCQ